VLPPRRKGGEKKRGKSDARILKKGEGGAANSLRVMKMFIEDKLRARRKEKGAIVGATFWKNGIK